MVRGIERKVRSSNTQSRIYNRYLAGRAQSYVWCNASIEEEKFTKLFSAFPAAARIWP